MCEEAGCSCIKEKITEALAGVVIGTGILGLILVLIWISSNLGIIG
ncbi:MAG: hypothetical protein ISR61_03545 [Desulfobacteraceae bacterium]|uniref:Uncharacterized protein n=1 Tax=Candidatus Desulfacyla euxinica TaxID=2841693 RepID=A0A8J6MYJ7_9DELT|nr:hypothetical protein [Candidatus Desulfacyla euxinica]MBL6977997.1 hypothetical protein [Desulfobacteraceae bacterium]